FEDDLGGRGREFPERGRRAVPQQGRRRQLDQNRHGREAAHHGVRARFRQPAARAHVLRDQRRRGVWQRGRRPALDRASLAGRRHSGLRDGLRVADRPPIGSMGGRSVERKLAAILSADVEGYSRLMGEDERLYGDGVNIAARLEGLAEGGGICISGTAYDQIAGKLPFRCESIGEHTVKNIARPVRVYRLHPEPGAPARPASKRRVPGRLVRAVAAAVAVLLLLGAAAWAGRRWLAPESAGLPLPDRPSVAVLPFTNLSQDPTQDYFSDGVTEDL